MEAKLKAVGKLQQVEELQRDRVGQQLELIRQRHQNLQMQLQQLSHLKTHVGKSSHAGSPLNSAVLMNVHRIDNMLQKMLVHHEQEQAVMAAQCSSVQKELEFKHARVKGLENVLQRWGKKQRYEQARKEQKLIEDIINARYKKKPI